MSEFCFDPKKFLHLIITTFLYIHECEITFNGVKITELYMPPYKTVVDKSLVKQSNELIITVSNTASNAFVHFELPKEWEEKHIGPYHKRAPELRKASIKRTLGVC